MKLKDKRGMEKLFSIWWFFVLIVVGLGIVGGVLMFYSVDVDIRKIESGVLYNQLINCVVKQGHVIDGLFDENFDIFEECGLNEEIINSGYFYFKINLLDDAGKNLKEISNGSASFEKDCKIKEKVEAVEYPGCTEKEESVIYYQDDEAKIATLFILTASNQKGKKISII